MNPRPITANDADRLALARYAVATQLRWMVEDDPIVSWESLPELGEHEYAEIDRLMDAAADGAARRLFELAGERGAELWRNAS